MSDIIEFELDLTPTAAPGKSTQAAGLAPLIAPPSRISAVVSIPAPLILNPDAGAGVAIKPEARDKGAQEAALAAKHGVETATIYANGTQMLQMGERVARGHRQAWERLPNCVPGAEALAAAVAQENRSEVPVDLNKLIVDDWGRLVARTRLHDAGAKRSEITDVAWSQLQEKAPAKAKSKRNLNSWLGTSQASPVLRVRDTMRHDGREVYAAVSKKYAPLDIHQVAAQVAEVMPKDARLRADYRAYPQPRGTLDFCLAPAYEVDSSDIAVGRVHRFGVRVRTADDASSAINIQLYAERIACINCTIMTGTGEAVSVRHVGDVQRIRDRVQAALNNMAGAVKEFSELWRDGNEAAIHRMYDGTLHTARDVFQRLVENGYVDMPGIKDEALVTALVTAWEREPGDTYASVHNAMTRLAHEAPQGWATSWATESLEEQASQLLYARVWESGGKVWAAAE